MKFVTGASKQPTVWQDLAGGGRNNRPVTVHGAVHALRAVGSDTRLRAQSCPCGAIHLLYLTKIPRPSRLCPQEARDIRKALKRQRLSRGDVHQ